MDAVQPDDLLIPKTARVLKLSDFGIERLVVIGDVHGCFDELACLLYKLELTDKDCLIFAGDLVDRGPDSPNVVHAVASLVESRPHTYCVMGNHEEKHIRYRRHVLLQRENPDYKIPMRQPEAAVQSLSDASFAWMASLYHIIMVEPVFNGGSESRIITHAGLMPYFSVKHPPEPKGLVRIQHVHQVDGKWTPHPLIMHGEPVPPGVRFWSDLWSGSARVIYGHTVHSETEPYIQNNCYGIDTGAVFGGRLTAYVENLRTGDVKFYQVDSGFNFNKHRSRDVLE